MTTSRRRFIQIVPAAGALLLGTRAAHAVMVNENDPQAKALGYVEDATKTDKTKYKQYAPGQICSNCSLWQGKATDPAAGCALFPGKQVANKGWCSAWVKKA
jgi:hypothetical protein